MTGPSAFHHDHYDPTDATIDPSLLTAVLSQHNITADNIWIFGFGSLVHTPGFAYTEKATVGVAIKRSDARALAPFRRSLAPRVSFFAGSPGVHSGLATGLVAGLHGPPGDARVSGAYSHVDAGGGRDVLGGGV